MIGNEKDIVSYKGAISILASFDTIPLYKMSKVGLMNRTDIKYVFSAGRLPVILEQLAENYKVMEIFQDIIFPYTTAYLDTPDDLFYHQHMKGKFGRYKIRYRKYELSGVSYLEIKKKTNKRRTEKERIVNTFIPDGFDERSSAFIKSNTPFNPELLQLKLLNSFNRTTLVNLEANERITFDFNLSFMDPRGKRVGLPFISVAELKREGHSNQSHFISTVKKLGIRPTGFSKYCVGRQYLESMPRYNLIKPKILLINKLENEYNRYANA